MIDVYLMIAAVLSIYMSFWAIASFILKDASIVDIGWGLGFILVAAMCLLISPYNHVLQFISVLVAVWGIRLSTHITRRKMKAPQEDWRYAAWREKWGVNWWWRSLLQVFLLQGIFLFFIALPLPIVALANVQLDHWVAIGGLIWLGGFIIEATADAQLRAFKNKSSQSRFLRTGLWRYSRHPNYFGEVLQWWGIWVCTIATPWWGAALVSPILITALIRFVSGVPMLEQKYRGNPEFEDYKKTTNTFVPWFPKF